MLLFLFLSALSLGAASPLDEPTLNLQRGACPMFWFSFKGRCYKYVATKMTWADAELYCVSQGANLVSIHSMEEQNFVRSLIKNFDFAEEWTWTGLSDIHKEGRWMWSDGSPANYFYWQVGQPDNAQGIEHCVHVNLHATRKWNDLPCHYTIPSVCATRINCP